MNPCVVERLTRTLLALSVACGATAANPPATAILGRPVDDPGAPLNLPVYAPAQLPGAGLRGHDFFYTGQYDFRNPTQRLVMVRGGRITWEYAIPTHAADAGRTLQEFSDATLLPDGRVAFARKTGAGVVGPDGRLLWNYDAPAGCEVHVCQPLSGDRVLVIQNGLPARLMVIHTPDGRKETEFELPTNGNAKMVHTQFRRARMTAAGAFLVAHHDQDEVVEYNAQGRAIWRVAARIPWCAVRLRGGHTLISSHDAYVREVDAEGRVVWEFTQKDVPDIAVWCLQEASRLDNGNTLISNWCPVGVVDAQGAKASEKWQSTVQALEVTADKKVVWALRAWTPPVDLGPATVVQLLDAQTGRPMAGQQR